MQLSEALVCLRAAQARMHQEALATLHALGLAFAPESARAQMQHEMMELLGMEVEQPTLSEAYGSKVASEVAALEERQRKWLKGRGHRTD